MSVAPREETAEGKSSSEVLKLLYLLLIQAEQMASTRWLGGDLIWFLWKPTASEFEMMKLAEAKIIS